MGYIVNNRIKCLRCGEIVTSRSAEEDTWCRCGMVAACGGAMRASRKWRLGNAIDRYVEMAEFSLPPFGVGDFVSFPCWYDDPGDEAILGMVTETAPIGSAQYEGLQPTAKIYAPASNEIARDVPFSEMRLATFDEKLCPDSMTWWEMLRIRLALAHEFGIEGSIFERYGLERIQPERGMRGFDGSLVDPWTAPEAFGRPECPWILEYVRGGYRVAER